MNIRAAPEIEQISPTGGDFPPKFHTVVTKSSSVFTLLHNNPQLVSCPTFVTARTILCFFFLICPFQLQVSSFMLVSQDLSFWITRWIARRLPHRTDYILIPAPLGTNPIWKPHKAFDRVLFLYIRSIPLWSHRKVAATCNYRYPFFSLIISWFLHRFPRRSSKAFSTGTFCILETLRRSTTVQNSLYPNPSIHHLYSHLSPCCRTSGDASPLLGVEYAERQRCWMDRFSILWRYTCSTPSKLCHQRTFRFTLVRFTYQTFFFFLSSCSIIRFFRILLKLLFMTLNFLPYSTIYFSFFFQRIIYAYFCLSNFSIQMSLGHFISCCFSYFVAFHFFDWRKEWQRQAGPVLLNAPRLDHAAPTLPPLGKVAKEGADFPPNREHYSLHTWMEIVFDLRPRHLRLLMMRPSSNLCSTEIHHCYRGFITSDNFKDKSKWRNVDDVKLPLRRALWRLAFLHYKSQTVPLNLIRARNLINVLSTQRFL